MTVAKPPTLKISGYNGSIPLTENLSLDTHDRAEYVIGCVLIFSNKRYILESREPEGAPNPGKENKVRLHMRRDHSTRKMRNAGEKVPVKFYLFSKREGGYVSIQLNAGENVAIGTHIRFAATKELAHSFDTRRDAERSIFIWRLGLPPDISIVMEQMP